MGTSQNNRPSQESSKDLEWRVHCSREGFLSFLNFLLINKLEATYNVCNIVLSICVYADPNRHRPIAIVVPAEATLSRFVTDKGLSSGDTSMETLVHDKKVVDAVHAELLAVGKRGGLTGIEIIQ